MEIVSGWGRQTGDDDSLDQTEVSCIEYCEVHVSADNDICLTFDLKRRSGSVDRHSGRPRAKLCACAGNLIPISSRREAGVQPQVVWL